MKRFYWSGVCKENRIAGISKLEQIINTHGFIINFNKFSDISLSLVIEIEKKDIDNLYFDLANYLNISEFEELNSTSSVECTVLLSVTFGKASGDLAIEVPNVPG